MKKIIPPGIFIIICRSIATKKGPSVPSKLERSTIQQEVLFYQLFNLIGTSCCRRTFSKLLEYIKFFLVICSWWLESKPSLKIRTANAICWNSLGLFRDYGLNHIFLGIKLFCFSRQKAETFSNCLKKPHKISTQSDNRQ